MASLGSPLKMIVAFLLLAAPVPTRADDAPIDESFYQQIARVVIRLENPETDRPVGTAFFSQYSKDNKHYYLVTARHVVESGIDLRARVPSQRKDTGETEIVELRLPGSIWVHHPAPLRTVSVDGKSETLAPIDVAIAKVSGMKDRRVRTLGYCPEPCERETKHQFLDEDPIPPTRVLVWGFPVDLGFTLEEQRPMGRIGLVAMVAKEPFIRTGKVLRDERVLLLDAPMFPGNSGSPILDYPSLGPVRLAGLVSASSVSLSFAIVEPVSRIVEAIHHAHDTEISDQAGWWYLLPGATN